MKIVMPGGSGHLGPILARAFIADGHEVVVLTRAPARQPWRAVRWDGRTLGPWAREVDGADVVINLAGRSVNCRYTEANKRDILDSRVDSTRVVGEAIAQAARPPRVWLQMSTATIYAHRADADNDERTGIIGGAEPGAPQAWHFSIDVARAWEQVCFERSLPNTRRVVMRLAMTMSPTAGQVFDTLMGLVRRGLGGPAGDGTQYLSWIHDVDFVRAVRWLIEHDHLEGVVNVSSPHPLPNADFMRTLRQVAGVRLGLPATTWMLELGAALMRTESELILKSRRVVPARLIESGFSFRYPTWPEAALELYQRTLEMTRGPARHRAA